MQTEKNIMSIWEEAEKNMGRSREEAEKNKIQDERKTAGFIINM